MKASVIKEMPDNELLETLSSNKEKLFKMKMTHAVSPLENPQTIVSTKKIIARIKTEISKRSKK
tara:strand:- start:326 stop:517 length:192 start_codon:yes stop_codon:yes gene_type:complete